MRGLKKFNIKLFANVVDLKGMTVSGDLSPSTLSIVSVFAGRIADTGRDPVPMMKEY